MSQERRIIKKEGFYETFLRWILRFYPPTIKMLTQIGGLSYNLITTFLTAFGAVAIVLLISVVEVHRISLGIAAFEENPTYVTMPAIAIVMLLMFLEVSISKIDHDAKVEGTFVEEEKTHFSLRIFYRRFKYFIGWSDDFEVKVLPPSHSLSQIRNSTIFAVMVLVIFGSLDTQIASYDNLVWYEGFFRIFLVADTQAMSASFGASILTYVTIIGVARVTNLISSQSFAVIESLNEQRTAVIQTEETQDGIYPVTKITKAVSRAYASLATNAKIVPEDRIDVVNNDFYDGTRGLWLREGKGYSNSATLKKNIKTLLGSR